MREIVIISGKGGAGKTSLTAAFAHMAHNAILCDCDVDTPDLHILLAPDNAGQTEFRSGYEAVIDSAACTGCGHCATRCRFGAVSSQDGVFSVNPMRCEGCKVCVVFCPEQAIRFQEKHCGDWFISSTRFGTLVHAQLHPGEENSGRLVSLLRQQAKKRAYEDNAQLIVCDGSPGIGCPVISSLRGAHLAVIVTEPTPSGIHDCERVAQLCEHFRLKLAVITNRADINPAATAGIHEFCKLHGYDHVADLPYDPLVVQAMIARKAITEFPETPLARQLHTAWRRIEDLAGLPGSGSASPV